MSPLACCKECPTEFDCVEEGCQKMKTNAAPQERSRDGSGTPPRRKPCGAAPSGGEATEESEK